MEVKEGNKFIRYHSCRVGRKRTKEQIRKWRETIKNGGLKSQLCECGCEQITKKGMKFIQGHNLLLPEIIESNRIRSSKPKPKEMRKKLSKSLKKGYTDGKIIPYWQGRKRPNLWNGCREDMKGMKPTKKQFEGLKKGWEREHTPTSDTTKKKQSKARYKYFTRNLERYGYMEPPELVKRRLRGNSPSSLEVKMMGIIEKFNLPYKFVGNGKFSIGNKIPDFVNVNGEKIALEVFYRRHKCQFGTKGFKKEIDFTILERWKEERKKIFSSFGWKVLFFNEIEVNDKMVMEKLKQNGGRLK